MVRRAKNEEGSVLVYYSGKRPEEVVQWLTENADPSDYKIVKNKKGQIETISFNPKVFSNTEFRSLLSRHTKYETQVG